MFTAARRSLFTVNEETPTSYFPDCTPMRIESNFVFS